MPQFWYYYLKFSTRKYTDFFFRNSRTLCVWDVFKRWALSLCVFCSSKSPKGCRGNVKAWEGAWGGGNMKIFEDWCTELTLLSIAAQMTTSLSAPPLEILSKVAISGAVWMKFLQELYFWSWAYSYAELETPTNSSHLATKWPRRGETGCDEPAPEPGSLGGWQEVSSSFYVLGWGKC